MAMACAQHAMRSTQTDHPRRRPSGPAAPVVRSDSSACQSRGVRARNIFSTGNRRRTIRRTLSLARSGCVCTLRRMNALCRVLAAAAVVPVAKSGCNCIAPHSSTSHIATSYLRRAPGGPVASRRWSRFTHRMCKIECSTAWTISIRLAIPCFVKWMGVRLIAISDCPLWMPF